MVKIERLGKSQFISELTSTNNSHSICGFSQLWRTCLQKLRNSSPSKRRHKEAACTQCLPCRDPQSTCDKSRICPSQGPGLCKFPLLQSYSWIGSHQVRNFVQEQDTGCMCTYVCVYVCMHTHAHAHVQRYVSVCVWWAVCRNSMSLK